MPTIKSIQNEIEGIGTIHSLSSALLEVSAMRVQKLRKDYEHNQRFFDEIANLYNIVKMSALHEKYKKDETIARQKKTSIHVAITSNKGFYGTLNTHVVDAFLTTARTGSGDCMVVGEIGKRYLEQMEASLECAHLVFKNDYPTLGETKVFLEKVVPYDQVFLYYPTFKSVFVQEVGIIDITYTPTQEVVLDKELEYIFEPELGKMVTFFETQVRHLLFMRIMLESELARMAARLMKMSATEERAEEMIEEKHRELKKQIEIINDIKLLESFSSIQQWVK